MGRNCPEEYLSFDTSVITKESIASSNNSGARIIAGPVFCLGREQKKRGLSGPPGCRALPSRR